MLDYDYDEGDTTNKLRKDGIALAPWWMPTYEMTELMQYLDQRHVRDGHVVSKAKFVNSKLLTTAKTDGEWPAFSHPMQDIVCAPYFFEYALKGYDIAAAYFGEPPRMYSMNCFWTAPSAVSYVDTHDWHRDGDDRKQLVMFMFGTDVKEVADGAHLYQRGTSRLPDGSVDHYFNNAAFPELFHQAHGLIDSRLPYNWQNPPDNVIETITGPAGTMFFSDTNGLHKGIRPNKARMLAWARWCVNTNPPASYYWDKLHPVDKTLLGERYPQDPVLQQAIRLVVS